MIDSKIQIERPRGVSQVKTTAKPSLRGHRAKASGPWHPGKTARVILRQAPLQVPTTASILACFVCVCACACVLWCGHQPSGTSLMGPQGAQTGSQTSLVASLRFKSIMTGSTGTVPASHVMMYRHPRTPVSKLPPDTSCTCGVTRPGLLLMEVTPHDGEEAPSKAPWVRPLVVRRSFARPFVANGWKHNLAAEGSKKKCADTGWTSPPGLVSRSPLTRRQIFPLPSAGASRAHLAWICGIAAEMHHTSPWYMLPNRPQVT